MEDEWSYHFPFLSDYIRLQVSLRLWTHLHPLHPLQDLSRGVSIGPPNNSNSLYRTYPPHPLLSPATHPRESISLSSWICNNLQLRRVLLPRSMAPGLIHSDHCISPSWQSKVDLVGRMLQTRCLRVINNLITVVWSTSHRLSPKSDQSWRGLSFGTPQPIAHLARIALRYLRRSSLLPIHPPS